MIHIWWYMVIYDSYMMIYSSWDKRNLKLNGFNGSNQEFLTEISHKTIRNNKSCVVRSFLWSLSVPQDYRFLPFKANLRGNTDELKHILYFVDLNFDISKKIRRKKNVIASVYYNISQHIFYRLFYNWN